MLKSPPSTDLPYMRFEGKEGSLFKLMGIQGVNVLTIFAARGNAMSNVTKEVEVFESAGSDTFVCPIVKLLKLHFWIDS